MLRKLIAVDLLPMERRAKELGFPHIPLREIREVCEADSVDVIEMLVTLPERQPEDDSPEALAKVRTQYINKRNALQSSGARVIECPSKRSQNSPSGFKQSDDQRLMLTTLMLAMKLRPDFVLLFAADGDFAPMVEILRGEGIRTEVVASPTMLASELIRQAVNTVDYDEMLQSIRR
ncbi:NYN domain-containing protein [Mailhella massiliensis]|uniref:NYN domain-containing protein n=1 Tax=Mailhella massiliensis TaxID=1903261 RepID=UPI00097DB976|nr:NYN domain-containing protein [Mailhella massiliensis]